MLTADMIAALRCPICQSGLSPSPRALRCEHAHSFDLAKQGYAFLGTGKRLPEGDNAAMIEARCDFLGKGHFAPLTTAVAQAARSGLVVDLGAGPGHYLAAVLQRHHDAQGLAFDVSKAALRRAARAHPRAGAVLADTWGQLPLADGCVDVLLNIFAPRNGEQMRRVLRPDGQLVVVTPEPGHLLELRQRLALLNVDESKQQRLAASLSGFSQLTDEVLSWPMELSAHDARQLVLMGPNAFHEGDREPGAMTVTASVRLSTWTGRPLPTRPAAHDEVL
nr:methyltransferase domain-containing protein [Rhizocola hellebori]